MIKKKSRKRREEANGGSELSPAEKMSQLVQEGHRQTGLKNFPEAVRLYSLVIGCLEHGNDVRIPSSTTFPRENNVEAFGSSSSDDEVNERKEREELLSNEPPSGAQTPLYVLYGCRSQAYQGMGQLGLALDDAERSIHHNQHHALAYVQKGKVGQHSTCKALLIWDR